MARPLLYNSPYPDIAVPDLERQALDHGVPPGHLEPERDRPQRVPETFYRDLASSHMNPPRRRPRPPIRTPARDGDRSLKHPFHLRRYGESIGQAGKRKRPGLHMQIEFRTIAQFNVRPPFYASRRQHQRDVARREPFAFDRGPFKFQRRGHATTFPDHGRHQDLGLRQIDPALPAGRLHGTRQLNRGTGRPVQQDVRRNGDSCSQKSHQFGTLRRNLRGNVFEARRPSHLHSSLRIEPDRPHFSA